MINHSIFALKWTGKQWKIQVTQKSIKTSNTGVYGRTMTVPMLLSIKLAVLLQMGRNEFGQNLKREKPYLTGEIKKNLRPKPGGIDFNLV